MSTPSLPTADERQVSAPSITSTVDSAIPLRALVLAGGLAFEREVSLHSGRRVSAALRHAGVDVEVLDADATLLPALAEHPGDAVFIALHGAAGEDGALRSVLELAGVPFVGSGSAASRLAWDKPGAKARIGAAGVATPDWVALPHSTYRELGASAVLDLILSRLGLPLMLKPAQGGSALGTVKVSTVRELPEAMIGAFAYADTVLIERFISGTEVAVSVLDRPAGSGPQTGPYAHNVPETRPGTGPNAHNVPETRPGTGPYAHNVPETRPGTGPNAHNVPEAGAYEPIALPAVEIVPRSGVFDYAARYTPGMTEYFTPARLDETAAARVAEVALTVHRTLGLSGLSRTDAIVTPAGEVYFLEVNVSPGMTDTSMLPMSVAAAGLDLGAVLADLLRAAAPRGGSGQFAAGRPR